MNSHQLFDKEPVHDQLANNPAKESYNGDLKTSRQIQWGFEYGTLKFVMKKLKMGVVFQKKIKNQAFFSYEQVWNIWIPSLLSIQTPPVVETQMLDFGICRHMVGQIF